MLGNFHIQLNTGLRANRLYLLPKLSCAIVLLDFIGYPNFVYFYSEHTNLYRVAAATIHDRTDYPKIMNCYTSIKDAAITLSSSTSGRRVSKSL